MNPIAFTVPGRPKGKGRARSTRSGRHYTPARTAAAENEIAQLAMIERGSRPLMTGTVVLSIEAVFRVPKGWSMAMTRAALEGRVEYTGKPDADNLTKLIGDALNGVLFVDDAQVQLGRIVRRYGTPERIEVHVEELQTTEALKSPAERRREAKLANPTAYAPRVKKRSTARSTASELLAIGKRVR